MAGVTVNVYEAKTQLSALLARVEAGEEVVIARAGTPIARLVRYAPGANAFASMRGAWAELGPLPSDEELDALDREIAAEIAAGIDADPGRR